MPVNVQGEEVILDCLVARTVLGYRLLLGMDAIKMPEGVTIIEFLGRRMIVAMSDGGERAVVDAPA